MTKYITYIIIAVLLVGAVAFVSNKFSTNSIQNTQTTERIPAEVDLGSTPVPVSEVNLDNKKAVETNIDTELKWIDGEANAANQADLNDSGLSDKELGL